ncbi:hypothetical protein CLIM01_02849 [Colletotrichum limetticola]|uniref:Uncharacterized protein n=1 Tax=Colletotrichum limetticola TaxID=1209924 RepID=A0ABQ9Q7K6_9PEZI|nr:hypothetical protein CLIM01_02849 [Colletotrichum limetticola]
MRQVETARDQGQELASPQVFGVGKTHVRR